jgi:hypothetical protein
MLTLLLELELIVAPLDEDDLPSLTELLLPLTELLLPMPATPPLDEDESSPPPPPPPEEQEKVNAKASIMPAASVNFERIWSNSRNLKAHWSKFAMRLFAQIIFQIDSRKY